MTTWAADLADRFQMSRRSVRLAVPFGLGASMALGHEPWLPFVPLFLGLTFAILIFPTDRRAAAGFGWLLGAGYFAVTLRWIIEPFLVDVPRHGWMAPFAIVLMAGGLALFWALAGFLARYIAGPRLVGMIWFAICLSGAEFARGHVFTGFPWGLWAYSLVGTFADTWLAWIGPFGLTSLIALMAGGMAYSLRNGRFVVWVLAVFGMIALTIYGQIRSAITMPVGTQMVRLVQPNAPQHQKWDPEWMPVFYNRAIELTAAGAAVDVVIWPETSVPMLLNHADPLLENMSMAAGGAVVVAGVQREAGGDYFNSLVVIDEGAEVSHIYDKMHLVPFGEYIPFAKILRPLGLGVLVDQVAGFARGEQQGLLEVEGLGLVRALICYEGIFPEEIEVSGERPDVLLIITNDGWFGTGPGPRQHLVQAQARAIEQGLPVIRSANTGISAVINGRGRIVDSLPLNTAGALDVLVPPPLLPTVYARTKDWPLTIGFVLLIVLGVMTRRRFVVDGTITQR